MGGALSFPPAFLDWLALVWGRLDAIGAQEGESDGTSQSREFAREIWRLRRECEVLQRSLDVLVLNGQLGPAQHAGMCVVLHDLRWLLEISPSAPPALARQCARIAQDRIFEEIREFTRELPDTTLRMMQSYEAA